MLTVKIKKTFLPAAAVAVSLYFMFAMPYSVSKGVTLGLKICFYTILPSLFPFMVLSTYIVKSDILSPIYKIISPITKVIFKQPPCAAGVIIMSLIGGFPVGAKMTMTLLESEKITENQAQRLNLFCVNCGPAFAITAIGVSIYKSQRAGVIIYASLCLSSIILGILSSFLNDKNTVDNKTYNTSQSPLAALSASVGDTVQAVLSVCAWIVIFSAISSCIESSGIDEKLHIAISCLLEVTNGCTLAAGRFSIPAVTAVIGFGGFCVHCQIYSFIRISKLKYKHFFVSRALNAALSALICQGLLLIFPVDLNTIAINTPITPIPFSVSLPAFFALTVMCIVMIFDIDTKKKLW